MIAYLVPIAILSVMVAYAAVTAYGRRFDPHTLADRLRPHLKALRGLARRPRRPRLLPDPRTAPRPPAPPPPPVRTDGPGGLPVRPAVSTPGDTPQPNPTAAPVRPADRLDQERWRRLGSYFATSTGGRPGPGGRRPERARALLHRFGRLARSPGAWPRGWPGRTAAAPPDGALEVTAPTPPVPVPPVPQPRATLPLGPAALPRRTARSGRPTPAGAGRPPGPANGAAPSVLADLAAARQLLRDAADALSPGLLADQHDEGGHRSDERERAEGAEHPERRTPPA